MATYYVVCINKHPTHQDPHNRIQAIGTNTVAGINQWSKKWSLTEAITAIERGDIFYCTDRRGDRVRCIVAVHNGNKYVKTQSDGIQADNLLAQNECIA